MSDDIRNDVMLRGLDEVVGERARQCALWGEDRVLPGGNSSEEYGEAMKVFQEECDDSAVYGDVSWADVLLEEVYEALAEDDLAKLQVELVQVAAVALAWWEQLELARDNSAAGD